jgi:uncharacterized protein YlxW (UPF0749 family)
MQNKPKNVFTSWQLPLAIVFLCFGFLAVAQYHAHVAYSHSLETQNYSNLSTLALGLMDRRGQLQAEVSALNAELENIADRFNSGVSLADTIEARITTLQTVTGAGPVSGPGVSVTITSESSQLIAYDLTDIVNELFVSGAEAVSINNQRVTAQTQIADFDAGYGNFSIVIDGQTLLSPVVIRAIGNPTTLEAGLVYPNGICDVLRILHIFPIVKQEEDISIAAALRRPLQYAAPPDAE